MRVREFKKLPITCCLIGLGTSINFFMEVLGSAFQCIYCEQKEDHDL